MERAWRRHEAEGDPVALGRTRHFAGHTETGIAVKVHLNINNIITTTLLYYAIMIITAI